MNSNGLAKFTLLTFLQKYSGIAKADFLKAHNADTDKPNSILVFKRCKPPSKSRSMNFPEPWIFVMNWYELHDRDTKLFGPVTVGKVQTIKQIYLPADCVSVNHGYFYWNPNNGLTYMNKSTNGTWIKDKKEKDPIPAHGEMRVTPGNVLLFGGLEGLLLSPKDVYQQLVKR